MVRNHRWKLYAIGGASPSLIHFNPVALQAYDATSDRWEEVADLPSARTGLGAAAGADGRIFVFGGIDVDGQFLDAVHAYFPDTGRFTE